MIDSYKCGGRFVTILSELTCFPSQIMDGVKIKEEKKEEDENVIADDVKVEHGNSDSESTSLPTMAIPGKPKELDPSPRPSSTTSNISSSSSGAHRTTTTSRRGGRTRSRSPPTMTNRAPAIVSERDFHESYSTSENRSQSQSPANPSSAAAAAAAAAKAFSNSNSSRNQNQWYEGVNDGSSGERRVDGPRFQNFTSSKKWPDEDNSEFGRHYMPNRSRENESDGRSYQRGSYPPERSDSGSQGEGYHPPGRRRHSQHDVGNFDANKEHEGRYQHSRSRTTYEPEGSRERPHYGAEGYRTQRYDRRREDSNSSNYRSGGAMSQVGSGRNGASSDANIFHQDTFNPKGTKMQNQGEPTSISKRSGGTSRVIGTATPIHVPRAADPSSTDRHHPPAGTPASVFRGRPGDNLKSRSEEREDDTPQKILLSLRTPSASFEEQQGPSKTRKPSLDGQAAPPLSPEEPPQIQHSHHKNQMDPSLFFEVGTDEIYLPFACIF